MNVSTLLGFFIAIVVLWSGVISHSARPAIFLDSHALILVLGGTIAAGLIAFPFKKFRELGQFLFLGVMYPPSRARERVVQEILELSATVGGIKKRTTPLMSYHPFLSEGYRLITKYDFEEAELRSILNQRSLRFRERYISDAKTLNALAKFPPAFGLLGATSGMIMMMMNLGGPGAQETIGPSMAVALVATFWGIALANFILLPLADHANRLASDDSQIRTLMVAGVIALHKQMPPAVVMEHLMGFLPVKERNNPVWRNLLMAAEGALRESHVGQEETVVDIKSRLKKTGNGSR